MSRIALFKAAAYSVSCLAILAGCSGGKQTASKVSIELPPANRFASKAGGVRAQSVEIRRIMVNVKGNGIPLQARIWQEGVNPYPVPTSFEFEAIPRNTQGTVQVLVVTRENSVEKLYYDLETFTANKPTVDPNIELRPLAVSGVQGNVAGRIVSGGTDAATQTGPSGRVNIFIQPSVGEEMLVEQSEIFSGWFDFFALADLPFAYRMEGQRNAIIPAFESFTPLRDDIFAANSTSNLSTSQAIRAYIPEGYRGRGGGDREYEPARVQVLGYFGVGGPDITRLVCAKPAQNTSFNGLFQSSVTTDMTLREWSNASPNTDTFWRTEGSGGRVLSSFGMTGAIDPSVCTATNAYLNTLKFDTTVDSNNGGSGRLGFQAPFVVAGANGDVITKTSVAGTSVTLGWKYLPGVFGAPPKPVQGTEIFARFLTPSDAANMNLKEMRDVKTLNDGYDCTKLLANRFKSVMDVQASTEDTNTKVVDQAAILNYAALSPAPALNQTVTALSSAWDEGRLQFVVCPYRSSYSGRSYYASSQAVSNQSSAIYVGISAPSSIAHNVCTPVVAFATDSDGVPITTADGDNVAVTGISSRLTDGSGGVDLKFYDESTCTAGNHITAFNLDGTKHKILFVKNLGTIGEIRPQFTVNGVQRDGTDMTLAVDNGTSGASDRIKVSTNAYLKINVCHPVLVYASDSSGKIGAGSSTYIRRTASAADVLYNDHTCDPTWGTSFQFTSSSRYVVKWVADVSARTVTVGVEWASGQFLAPYSNTTFEFY